MFLKGEIDAEALFVQPRRELLSKVERVAGIHKTGRMDEAFHRERNRSFAQHLTKERDRLSNEQQERRVVQSAQDEPLTGTLEYYDRSAMNAYFCLAAPVTNIRC